MRVLLHHDRPEVFADLVTSRFDDIEVELCRSYDALAGMLASFAPEVMFCIKFENRPYPRAPVIDSRSLKWVGVGGVGVDHLVPWDPSRLTVTNGAGVPSEVMGMYVIGGIIALTMGLPRFIRQQMQHVWKWHYVGQVAGRTVTVVGLGHTGRAVARLATGIGLRVVGTRARPRPTEHVDRVYGASELHKALSEGDYVVVATPLIEGTRDLIDHAAIEAMKPGAYVIDVSRGGVVGPEALLAGLRSGKLGGAMLDVFETEPMPPDSPFWDLENVIITPHSSGVFEGWERSAVQVFCDNLVRWRAGEPLANVVDPARGY